MKSRLLLCFSFLLLAAALFWLPAGTRKRLARTGRAFVEPTAEMNAMGLRVAREALGGLPPDMTVSQRDDLLAELAKTRNALEVKDAASEALKAENDQLRRLLRYVRQPRDYSLVVAGVAAQLAGTGSVVLDRGSADGILAGQAVMTLEGLSGIVSEASIRRSVVTLLGDKDFSIPVEVPSRQTNGILENRKGKLLLVAPMGAGFDSLEAGDVVCTTDLGSEVMQPGLLVGTIREKLRAPDDSPIYVIEAAASFLESSRYFLIAIPEVK